MRTHLARADAAVREMVARRDALVAQTRAMPLDARGASAARKSRLLRKLQLFDAEAFAALSDVAEAQTRRFFEPLREVSASVFARFLKSKFSGRGARRTAWWTSPPSGKQARAPGEAPRRRVRARARPRAPRKRGGLGGRVSDERVHLKRNRREHRVRARRRLRRLRRRRLRDGRRVPPRRRWTEWVDGIRRGAPLETHGARERRARADRASRRGRGRIAKRRLRPRRARSRATRASSPRSARRARATSCATSRSIPRRSRGRWRASSTSRRWSPAAKQRWRRTRRATTCARAADPRDAAEERKDARLSGGEANDTGREPDENENGAFVLRLDLATWRAMGGAADELDPESRRSDDGRSDEDEGDAFGFGFGLDDDDEGDINNGVSVFDSERGMFRDGVRMRGIMPLGADPFEALLDDDFDAASRAHHSLNLAPREGAIVAGMAYVYREGFMDETFFRNWASDMLVTFYHFSLAATEGGPAHALATRAVWRVARHWLESNPEMPPGATSEDVLFFNEGCYVLRALGIPHESLARQLDQHLARFESRDYFRGLDLSKPDSYRVRAESHHGKSEPAPQTNVDVAKHLVGRVTETPRGGSRAEDTKDGVLENAAEAKAPSPRFRRVIKTKSAGSASRKRRLASPRAPAVPGGFLTSATATSRSSTPLSSGRSSSKNPARRRRRSRRRRRIPNVSPANFSPARRRDAPIWKKKKTDTDLARRQSRGDPRRRRRGGGSETRARAAPGRRARRAGLR